MTTANVDQAEVAKFDALASRWWDPDGEFKPLHDINPLRLGFIKSRAPLTDCAVLDVGCGGGVLSEALADEYAQVTGIDMAAAPLEIASLHLIESGLDIDYVQSTAEDYADAHPDTFDVVTCMEMLEHVPEPASTIAACARLVRPGGHVFFSTLNRTPKAWLLAVLGAEYLLRMLPRGTHEYAKFIRPSELARWAQIAGLEVREFTGVHYHPLSRRYTLGPGLDVNYLVHCVRPQD